MKSLWARLSTGRRNYGILHGSGPTILPVVYCPKSLPDILQLCAEGLDLFPVCACQVPETKILSRNQPSPARNIPVPNTKMILWHVEDVPKNKTKNTTKNVLLLLIYCFASSSHLSSQDHQGPETSPSGSDVPANSFQWSCPLDQQLPF